MHPNLCPRRSAGRADLYFWCNNKRFQVGSSRSILCSFLHLFTSSLFPFCTHPLERMPRIRIPPRPLNLILTLSLFLPAFLSSRPLHHPFSLGNSPNLIPAQDAHFAHVNVVISAKPNFPLPLSARNSQSYNLNSSREYNHLVPFWYSSIPQSIVFGVALVKSTLVENNHHHPTCSSIQTWVDKCSDVILLQNSCIYVVLSPIYLNHHNIH